MKKTLLKLIFIVVLYTIVAMGQTEPLNCFTDTYQTTSQIGGKFLPATGTIKSLFIFAQFPDDEVYDPNWCSGYAPTNMDKWIDSVWTGNPTQGSLTHYFAEMSFNQLKFIGKSYYVMAPHTRQWYLDSNYQSFEINRDIILKLNSLIDFSEFDRWDYNGVYNFSEQPDGVVDYINITWRNVIKDNRIFKRFNIHKVGDLGDHLDISVDNNLRLIKTKEPNSSSLTPTGSGSTITEWVSENMFRFAIHEFAHYLIGDDNFHTGFGFWGMLSGYGIKSYVINSFERLSLGWSVSSGVSAFPARTITDTTLSDFVTTGDFIKININNTLKEYFYLENHQKLSYWEKNNQLFGMLFGNVEKGVYLIRQNSYLGSDIECIPADGFFMWSNPVMVQNPWGSAGELLPVFKRNGGDRINGYSDLNLIPYIRNGEPYVSPIYFTQNKFGVISQDVRYCGDGKDAFRMGYNTLFTPYSNPASYRIYRQPTPYGFLLKGENSGVYTLDLFISTSETAPPSKPAGLVVSNINNFAHLEWEANAEPDMRYSGKYKIYRTIVPDNTTPSNWEQVAVINAYSGKVPVTNWTDNSLEFNGGNSRLCYRLVAVDNSLMESLPSEYDWIPFGEMYRPSAINESTGKFIKLNQNYPNPFSGKTELTFETSDEVFVTIKIYSTLGEEIQTAVENCFQQGKHTIELCKGEVPAGVYLYRVDAVNKEGKHFIQSKLMVKVK